MTTNKKAKNNSINTADDLGNGDVAEEAVIACGVDLGGVSAAVESIEALRVSAGFRQVTLTTIDNTNYQLLSPKTKSSSSRTSATSSSTAPNSKQPQQSKLIVRSSSSSSTSTSPSTTATAVALTGRSGHDRVKRRLIGEDSPFLEALGVTKKGGGIAAGKASKLKQINRFVEIFGSVVSDAVKSKPRFTPERNNKNNNSVSVNVVDIGAGRGYLTFAVYDYLTRAARAAACGIDKESVKVVGVERRAELVQETNEIASRVGFSPGLEFVATSAMGSSAEEWSWIRSGQRDDVDCDDGNVVNVLIALHACDTATDDALMIAIKRKAHVVLTAPCCHKEVRREMVKVKGRESATRMMMGEVMRHGILLERQAEIATDALRALVLEAHGYEAKVFEFVSGEHTAKNLMIVGVRKKRVELDAEKEEHGVDWGKVEEFMDFYGIKTQRLVRLLRDGS